MLSMLKKDRHPNIITFGSAFKDRDQLCVSLELANMVLNMRVHHVVHLCTPNARSFTNADISVYCHIH